MDVRFDLNGTAFVWGDEKARLNIAANDGITLSKARKYSLISCSASFTQVAMAKLAMLQ